MFRYIMLSGVLCAFLSSCNSNNQLPVYGPKQAVAKKDGPGVDSIDYTVPGFSLLDQDSNTITAATTQGKVYVADFFFTSCPSICPKMMKEMSLVYDKYKGDNNVVILSYSIDPERDTVAKLKKYEAKLGIKSDKWHLLTGNKDSIYNLAEKYLVSASEDPDAPGGHVHDGNFILVDKQRRIRGYYDGTKDESVQKLLKELDELLKEESK